MASLAFPISRLVDPVVVLLAIAFAGLWLSRRRLAELPAAPPASGGRLRRAFAEIAARRVRIGRTAAWAACAALWLLATPVLASAFARAVSLRPRDIGPDLAGTTPDQRALVVLGATISPDELGVPAMERLS